MAQALRLLHQQGRRPETATGPDGLLPLHLAPLRSAPHVRGEFPLCIAKDDAGVTARPVNALIDEAVQQLALQGDEAEQCAKVARKLRQEMADMANHGAQESLSELWGAAATTLIANTDLPEAEREAIRRDVSRLRGVVNVDGLVIPFHPSAPMRLLRHVADHVREARALQSEIAELEAALQERLDGTGNGQTVSPDREERLVAVLETLAAFPDSRKTANGTMDGASAQRYVTQETERLLSFFRALHIARLEIQDAYDDEDEDLLAHFSFADLTPEDRLAIPPILLHLDTQFLSVGDYDQLLALLNTDFPLKLLVTVDRLYDRADDTFTAGALSGWRTSLAQRAIDASPAFVLQATAAQARLLMQGFNDGLRYDGPALFFVYTGSGTDTPSLPADVTATAALSSRAFPAFVYDPSLGDTWAARFRLAENPQDNRLWPEMDVPDTATTSPFTPLDFLACDAHLADQFMVLPSGQGQETLVPAADYLAAASIGQAGQVPFITLADEAGKKRQVVGTRALLQTAAVTARRWRHLQERGGINNSHAALAVAAEQERLNKAFEVEKQAISKKHEAEIEQVTETLAQQLVSNIAAGLLNLTDTDVDLAVPPPEPAAKTAKKPAEKEPVEAPPAEPEAVEAEEDTLSFDEPYVETPECTSCDECINVNAAIFAYNEDEKAYIKDPRGGPYRDLVTAAENCPAKIIHPGKPLNPNEPGLDELLKRAEPYL